MITHSNLGASSAERWISCPGSINLSRDIPRTTTAYAAEGTAAHELAERCLRAATDPHANIGEIIQGFPVDEEMADAVQGYVATILEDYEGTNPEARLFIEEKFNLAAFDRPDMYGTNDAMIGEPFGLLRVYDFKYGKGYPVEVEGNPQLKYYGLGALRTQVYEEVELVIIQPRASHPDGPVRRSKRMPVEQLVAWGETILIPSAVATEAPDAPLHIGAHCKFCPALAVCPEQRAVAVSSARDAFADPPRQLPVPQALAPADLRVVLERAAVVEAWFEACRQHAHHLLETGAASSETLGHKLVAGRAVRKWSDETEAERWLVATLGAEGAYEKKILSPAKAEKITDKKAVAAMVTETRGAQLAPVSDKRPSIAPAFTEVEIL